MPYHPCLFFPPLSTETTNSLSTQKINVLSTTLENKTEPHWCPQATHTSKSNVISVRAGEPTYSTNRTLCLWLLRGFRTTARWETNGYCFPTIPMAGSGTWLPCGMTPHPWLHPEVTPNLPLFAEANIKTTTASQLTSTCYPMELPLDSLGFT